MSLVSKDTIGGFFTLLLGLSVLIFSASTLPVGSLTEMGPGFVPVLLGSLLFIFGTLIVILGVRTGSSAITPSPLRSTLLITASPIAFALLVRPIGLAMAVFAASLLTSIASPNAKLGMSLLISASLTILSIALFSYALGVPTPLVGSLIRWW